MRHFLDGHQVHPIAVLVLNEPTNDAAPFHLGFNVSAGNGSLIHEVGSRPHYSHYLRDESIDEWSYDGVPCVVIPSRISTE